jgi:uncharacterized protein YjgD (DUF1641 family)
MSLVLNVEILGEFKKLTAATQGAQNSLAGMSKKMSSVARGIGRVVGALGITLGFAAIVRGFKETTAAAEDARVANDRIDAIAKSMDEFGNQTAKITKRIKDYADSQEFLLGVDADVIKATQAKLLTFRNLTRTAGEMGGTFDRATKAAIDMAAAGFGSAESNATQLGKALNDPIKGITALNRAGIQFTADQQELIKSLVESGKVLEAQDLILKEIESQVGGTAAATATATEKMRLAFGAVQESVGQLLLPVLEKFSAWFIKVLPDIQKFMALLMAALNSPQVQQAFTSLGKSLGNLGNSLAKLFGITAGPEANGFVSFFTVLAQILDGIVQTIDLMVNSFKNAFPVFNTFSNLVNGIAGALVSISGYTPPPALTSPTIPGSPTSSRTTPGGAKNVTININKGNVTAKEIANAVNKGAKVGGAPILSGVALRNAIRN